MKKLIFTFSLTVTLQMIAQTADKKSSKLLGTWLNKEFNIVSVDGISIDSSITQLEFKQNSFYTIRYIDYYKDPKLTSKPIIRTGKWKINWDKKTLHLYSTNEESPSPHQTPDTDKKIVKLTQKQFTIYENTVGSIRKRVYLKLK